MSEPYFPPPQKKESAPYRAAAELPIVAKPRPPIAPPRAPRQPDPLPLKRTSLLPPTLRPPEPEQEAPRESFLEAFVMRFGIRVAALAVVVAALKLVVWLTEAGAKWPQAFLIVLGVVGIIAAPVVLYFRLRRLWRFLFARNDNG